MYLDPRLTDAEILKACAYAESPHLLVIAQRLRERCADINRAREHAQMASDLLDAGYEQKASEALSRCIDQLTPKP